MIGSGKHLYKYSGPVYRFDDYYCNWKGETWAVSDKSALNNLTYRFKSEEGYYPGTNFTLDPKKLVMVH